MSITTVKYRGLRGLSPPIANFVKNAGYATVEDFEKFLAPAPPSFPGATMPPAADAAAKAPAPKAKMPAMGGNMAIIVTGGTNNNYYSIGGLCYRPSVNIDAWR